MKTAAGNPKKKLFITILVILAAIVLILLGAFAFLKNRGVLQTGRVILSEGSCLFISDQTKEPIVLHNQTKNTELYSDLKTGDRVLVAGDGSVMLSYPAQMNIYFLFRLSGGDLSDVPQETLDQLKDMGW